MTESQRELTPLCDSQSRRMGFAFERKPSVSSLTSGGAKNIRQRRIPPFQVCSTNWNLSNCSTNRNYQIRIYLSVSINTALHGEPSAPSKFSGAAFKKYIPSDTSAKRIPSSKTTSADNSARWTAIGALCGPIV